MMMIMEMMIIITVIPVINIVVVAIIVTVVISIAVVASVYIVNYTSVIKKKKNPALTQIRIRKKAQNEQETETISEFTRTRQTIG